MSGCGTNSLIMGRTPNSGSNCKPASCGNSGCDPELGPRHNRGKIIEEIKDVCFAMLGAPVIDLELSDQQVNVIIDWVLKIMEYYAPQEYFKYYSFRTIPGKSVYEMPPDIGYVRQVYYKQVPEFAFQSSDLDGAIPIEYFYPGGAYASIQGGLIDPIQPIWGRMGDWAVYKSYERMYSRLSSSIGGWEFVGGYKHIKLYPIPYRAYHVSIHYMQRCHDWAELTEPMIDGVSCHLKIALGRIRSKYTSPPGPGGGLQLDGSSILQEGLEGLKQWKEDLINRWGDIQGPIFFG